MEMNRISINNDGYVFCRSRFYTAHDILNHSNYTFSPGINKLIGEIDSGNWGVSYLLSMYKYRPKDFVLFEEPRAFINAEDISLKEMAKYSCYMDREDPLFSVNAPVNRLIAQGLKYSKMEVSVTDIKNIFYLSEERVERSLSCAGNEIFRLMSAIAFSHKKEIFCFPWMSKMRFDGYHENLTVLLQILERLKKIVILPIGKE